MKAKVVIVYATVETAESLYVFVKKINTKTSIKAYPSFDNEAVFFPMDKYDLKFIKQVLTDKGFDFKIENAE